MNVFIVSDFIVSLVLVKSVSRKINLYNDGVEENN